MTLFYHHHPRLKWRLRVCQALSHQEKAVMSSERLQGIDHPQAIQDYVSSCNFSYAETDRRA